MSPAVTILLEKINFSTFVLVMSAVNFSLLFVGCFMRPPCEYKNKNKSIKKSSDEINEDLNNSYVTYNKEFVTNESFLVFKENTNKSCDELMKEYPKAKSNETKKR